MKYLLASLLLGAGAVSVVSGESLQQEFDRNYENNKNNCACMYDDPHINTYDGRGYGCQGEGDFILTKSLTSGLEAQGRFYKPDKLPSPQMGTATKGMVINTGVAGDPKVEIFAGESNNRQVSGCKNEWLFDGESKTPGAFEEIDGAIFRRSGIERVVYFRNSGITAHFTKKYYSVFGCYINTCICLPDKIKREEKVVGLFGTPNGRTSDDFMTSTGKQVAYTRNKARQNQYCMDNWCVGETGNSLFEEPDILEHCKARTDAELDEAVKNAAEEIKDACEGNDNCITDAVVTNDKNFGTKTVEDEKETKQVKVLPPPTPEDEVEEDVKHNLDFEAFDGNQNCEALGYDFGYKMEGCFEGKAGAFDSGKMTLTDQAKSCRVTDVGSFKLDCSVPDGNQFKKATLGADRDAVVIMKGGNGGTIYTGLKADMSYTVDVGANKGISHIEFCFKCAEIEPECSPQKQCPQFSCVQGSFCPTNTCVEGECIESQPECSAEKMCPQPSCLENEKCWSIACKGGECVKGDLTCPADKKECEDGSLVSRDPRNDCAYPNCPVVVVDRTPVVVDETPDTTSAPGTMGDPHFKTHGGEMYDFHGGCDLVLLDNPEFQNGLGMKIHVRTKVETWWSYVQSAVVQIGEETVEINGDNEENWLYTNGLPDVHEDKEWKFGSIAGLVLRSKQSGTSHEAHIQLGNGEKILLKTFDRFVKVELIAEGDDFYHGSHGLLGRFPDGKRVGRDGVTTIEDVNEFGQAWQVLPTEPQLFHSYEADWVVRAGQKCDMPVDTVMKKQLRQRRLANGMPMQEAEKACAHLGSADDRKACVFDVVATQDVNMASVW